MSKSKQPESLATLLRRAIAEGDLNRYQLAKRGDLRYSAVWRFVAKETCDPTLATADKILSALGLRVELKPVRKPKRTKGR